MSGPVLQVLWAKPSIAVPGAETVVTRESAGKQLFRAYEIGPDGTLDPLSHAFTMDRAIEVADKLLRGDPNALGDARATMLVAACVLAYLGLRPDPPRDLPLPDQPRAGELG